MEYTMNLNQFEKVLQNLDESPMFHLSLTSKELFHSNFIYWLCRRYRQDMSRIFSEYIDGSDYSEIDPDRTAREKENNDLAIYFKDNNILIIENKVKSLPDKDQLLRYYKDQKKNHGDKNLNFLLLSLSEPGFDLEDTKWQYINYHDFAEKLKSIKIENNVDSYRYNILNDYMSFIDNLQNFIFKIQSEIKESNFDFYYHGNENDELYKKLKGIRLLDFYHKKSHEILALIVKKEIVKRKLIDENKIFVNQENIFIKNKMTAIKKPSKLPYMLISYGYERSGAFSSVKYCNKKINIGLTVQDNRYQKFTFGHTDKKIHQKLYENRQWFEFDKINDIQENTQFDIYPDRKDFNQFYKGNYKYRYAKLDENLKVENLINAVVNDVEHMIKVAKNFK